MPAYATIRTHVVDAREHLRAKVDGLQRRITHARSYVASPWIQFGAALALGYMVGRDEHDVPDVRRASRRPKPIVRRQETHEPIIHALVRTALMTLVSSAIRRALTDSGTNEREKEVA